MFLGLALVLGYWALINFLDAKYPQWHLKGTPPPPSPAAVTASATTAPTTQTALASGTGPSTAPVTPGSSPAMTGGLVPASGEPKTALLGSVTPDDKTYSIGVELSTRGASVSSVTLNKFKKVVDNPERYVFQQATKEQGNVLATKTIKVDGVPVDLSGVEWKLESASPAVAEFSTEISKASVPVLRVSKTFRLSPSTDASAGYEVKVEYAFKSLTGAPVSVATETAGPIGTPWEIERGPERQVTAAFLNQRSKQVVLQHHYAEEFKAEKASIDLSKDPDDAARPLSWIGSSGAYFLATLRPESIDPKSSEAADYVESVKANCLNPSVADSHLRDITTTLTTKALTVSEGGLSIPMRVYFGPKQRSVLDNKYYGEYPLSYDDTLVTTSWLCSFCTFPWLIRLLVGLLNVFQSVVQDWGVAIILLVLVVRALLHPITRKSQQNMAKMQKLSPELERIKKKYGDDKEGLNKAMMEFYKEQGATPVMGCLPMFLQMPIWLALYAGLQSTFELRHQPFLYGLTWIHDLAKPDNLVSFTPSYNLPIPFCGAISISGIHVIPFLLAVVFWFQYKLTPKPPAQTEEQAQQQKMMQWMTLIMPVFLYPAPSGLNIYVLTSTTLGIIESKLIRDSIKRHEAAGAEGKVVVEGDDGDRRGTKATVRRVEKKKTGWLAKLEELQEKAEEIRRQQGKK
jgi:YidC/Oxa1 family membrane protein insertase